MGLMKQISFCMLAIGTVGLVGTQEADAQNSGRKKVIRLEAEDVKGTVQKPELEIFMSRQNLRADEGLELRDSFLPRIIESVEKKPF